VNVYLEYSIINPPTDRSPKQSVTLGPRIQANTVAIEVNKLKITWALTVRNKKSFSEKILAGLHFYLGDLFFT
jgi:hypothetical protein